MELERVKYDVIGRLGSGAFGDVKLVNVTQKSCVSVIKEYPIDIMPDLPLKSTYALKELLLSKSLRFHENRPLREYLQKVRKAYVTAKREISLLLRCEHENIIKLHMYRLPSWERVKVYVSKAFGEIDNKARGGDRRSNNRRPSLMRRASVPPLRIVPPTENLGRDHLTVQLFTEYIEKSQNLSYYVKQNLDRITDPLRLEITMKLLQALAYLHEKAKIIHRDIKPANVLVSSSDTLKVKLIDFGHARDLDEHENVSHSLNGVVGSVLYQAPETIDDSRGAEGYYNAKIDVWGVGCVLNFLCTGMPLWHINTAISAKENTKRIRHKIKLLEFDNAVFNPQLPSLDGLNLEEKENVAPKTQILDKTPRPVAADIAAFCREQLLLGDPEQRPGSSKALEHCKILNQAK